jgi:hypothetical protein
VDAGRLHYIQSDIEDAVIHTPEQLAVIDLIKETLAQALEGNIDCVAIVACMPGGYASVMSGNRPGDLMLGAFDLQCKVREATQDSPKTASVSRIVRARTV